MPKKAKYRNIISNDYFTPLELANCIGVSVATIYRHIRDGLPADKGVIPNLICGKEAKEFYIRKYCHNKIKSGPGEILCHGCHKLVSLKKIPCKCIFTGRYYCQNKIQVQVLGRCPFCNRKFSRFKSLLTYQELNTGAEIPIGMLTGDIV